MNQKKLDMLEATGKFDELNDLAQLENELFSVETKLEKFVFKDWKHFLSLLKDNKLTKVMHALPSFVNGVPSDVDPYNYYPNCDYVVNVSIVYEDLVCEIAKESNIKTEDVTLEMIDEYQSELKTLLQDLFNAKVGNFTLE